MTITLHNLPGTPAGPRKFAGKIRHVVLGFASALLLFSALSPTLAAADEMVQVVEVIDGDTVSLKDGRRVRYLGINTPERNEGLHQQAKKMNSSLVKGRRVRLEFDGNKTDSYGRLLAYVYSGNEMLNVRMVREGLAHALFIESRGEPRGRHNDLLLRSQAEAKQRHAGMWAGQGVAKKLKITSVHPAETASGMEQGSSVRIASLADSDMNLRGYILTDNKGHQYVFPKVNVKPGYSVLVSGRQGRDNTDGTGQLLVHWPVQDSVWNPAGGIAYLMDPAGTIVDAFPYGEQVAPPASDPARNGKIIGNKSSKIYHAPGQSSYDRIKEENRVYFNSETEAQKAGYRRAQR